MEREGESETDRQTEGERDREGERESGGERGGREREGRERDGEREVTSTKRHVNREVGLGSHSLSHPSHVPDKPCGFCGRKTP